MPNTAFISLRALVSQPQALEDTIQYLSEKMGFISAKERVLICFPQEGEDSIGTLIEQAVLRRQAVPVIWGSDLRWKTLLRLAFDNRVGTIIGPPLVILGLTKLAKINGTPLYIRNVVTAGYPCQDWMIDGIVRGLDCATWGCFDPGTGPIVAGFSCGRSRGVHLRREEYDVAILDEAGQPVPEGEIGEVVLYPKRNRSIRYDSGVRARLERVACPCGCEGPRLMDIAAGNGVDPELAALGSELQNWSSVLDCRVERGTYGLELEIVCFPGRQMPKLPSCAKQIVRPWDPERDVPFGLIPSWKIPSFSGENH